MAQLRQEETVYPGPDHSAASESVLLGLFALFLLVTPLAAWWMQLHPPWYFSYLLWAGLIVLNAALGRRLGRYDL